MLIEANIVAILLGSKVKISSRMLREKVYPCKNAGAMLEMNLAPELGLANGSTGTNKNCAAHLGTKS